MSLQIATNADESIAIQIAKTYQSCDSCCNVAKWRLVYSFCNSQPNFQGVEASKHCKTSCKGGLPLKESFMGNSINFYLQHNTIKNTYQLTIPIISSTWEVIYQTREIVFLHQYFKIPRSGLNKPRHSRVFLADFEVFEYLMKHSFERLIKLLNLIIKYREN